MTIASRLSNVFEVVIEDRGKGIINQMDIHKLHPLRVICNVGVKGKGLMKNVISFKTFLIFYEVVFKVGGQLSVRTVRNLW